MDGKKQIRLDSAQGDVIEENIDISVGFTAACSLYLILEKGLKEVEFDIKHMMDAWANQKDPQMMESLKLQIDIAKLAYNNGKKFLEELKQVINELTPPEKKKVIIHKPNWKP